MEIREAKKISIHSRLGGQYVKNQVCTFWLQGRCTKNPCRFMHRESPPPPKQSQLTPRDDFHPKQSRKTTRRESPPQPKESQLAPRDDFRPKQSRKTTWRNPNYVSPGTATDPSKDKINVTSDKSTPPKVLANTGGKSGHIDQNMPVASQQKDLTVLRAEPEKESVQKALRKQCKYWVTGNCVYGDNCTNVHSWFSGSGFVMLAKLEGHNKAITGISLPSGCDKLYSGSKDGSVRAWDCNSGQCAGSVSPNGEVGCLITEGPWLFVGLTNSVKVWNLQNHAEFSLVGPAGLVNCMVVDENIWIAGVEDGAILVWKWQEETNTPEPAANLKEHRGAVCSLVIGAKRLYSGSRDCTIKVWDMENFHCLQTLYGHTRDVMSVLCWDSYLLSASRDNTLKVWCATESGAIEVVCEMKEDYELISLCGIHDAEAKPILLCSCSDNTVRLYDLPSFTERGRIFSKREVQTIRIGIDGLFFTGDASGDISVWKLLGPQTA